MTLSTQTSLSLELFTQMLRIRMIEEMIADRYSEQKMRCPVHLSIGQEAVAVGACKAALHSDYLVSNHRAHAHYLAKGGNLKAMIAEIYGKKTGCCGGRGGSMHLIDTSVGMYGSTPIVAGSIPVGVGLALASKMRGENRITLIFLGEGSTEEGVFSESLNVAVLKKLSILFVCENNFYSVYSPLAVRQPPNRDRIAIAKAHGLHVNSGYGNDVEEVYAKCAKAIDQLRGGAGPHFLEFTTYRYREHCGPNFDTDLGYRTKDEVAHWEKQCPIHLYLQKYKLDAAQLSALRSELAHEIQQAFTFAEQSPFPTFDSEAENPYA